LPIQNTLKVECFNDEWKYTESVHKLYDKNIVICSLLFYKRMKLVFLFIDCCLFILILLMDLICLYKPLNVFFRYLNNW